MQLKFHGYKEIKRLKQVDVSKKIIKIYVVSIENIKAIIVLKLNDVYVL